MAGDIPMDVYPCLHCGSFHGHDDCCPLVKKHPFAKKTMKELIGRLYYWWWHDFVCRKEPYTHQARRHVKSWWLLWVIGAGLGGSGIVWFLLHLGGFC